MSQESSPDRYIESYSDRHYPVILDLGRELSLAIEKGDLSEIVAVLDGQEPTAATEMISNAMLTYDYLYDQSMDLIELSDALQFSGTAKDILVEVGQTLQGMQNRFNTTFAIEETASECVALEGDNYLRDVMKYEGKKSLELLQYIARKDISDLSSPKDCFDEMGGVMHYISSDLTSKALAVWESGASEEAIDSLFESVEFHLGIIDEKLGPAWLDSEA